MSLKRPVLRVLNAAWLVHVHILIVSQQIVVHGHPNSRPYVAYRTSPFDQPDLDHNLTFSSDVKKSRIRRYNQKDSVTDNDKCPLQFTLGLSRRSHMAPAQQQQQQRALAITSAPVLYPVHPSRGPGRQVLHATQYEHLDLLSPSRIPLDAVIQEGLVQQEDFPLLFESSSFLSSPLLHDVNGDGFVDAIVTDYDGGVFVVGLANPENAERLLQRAQVPRLYLRRDWVVARLNETSAPRGVINDVDDIYDPFHSHFEYGDNRHNVDDNILQGVTADLMGQNGEDLQALDERRSRRVTKEQQEEQESVGMDEMKEEKGEQDLGNEVPEEVEHEEEGHVEERMHRRLQEIDAKDELLEQAKDDVVGDQDRKADVNPSEPEEQAVDVNGDPEELRADDTPKEIGRDLDGAPPAKESGAEADVAGNGDDSRREKYQDELDGDLDHDVAETEQDDDWEAVRGGEEYFMEDDEPMMGDSEEMNDDVYPYGYDDYYYGRHERNELHERYYDDQNYIRIPPHVLCSPVLMEFPKLYGTSDWDVEELLFVPVSYYLDEDEYEGFFSYKRFENVDVGDESEVQRGMYVASAIMVYQLGKYPRWTRQEHLDLSTDPTAPQNATLVGAYPIVSHETQMGAFALSPPTLADIDGDGSYEMLMGTSMGIVYGFDGRHMYKKDGWPVQMKHAVESRILVEDVVGDTNLEVFVADIGGNVVCLDKAGTIIWHRDLLHSLAEGGKVRGSSPMTLGDVNGDGVLDLVLVLSIVEATGGEFVFVVAVDAATGEDLENFPVSIEPKTTGNNDDDNVSDDILRKLPQPLLVDLHSDQSQWQSYLVRNGTKASHKNAAQASAPHGGSALGMHIVQPVDSYLYIIEAGSTCVQAIDMGDEITAMVQADDVHGTNSLDLVVSTKAGNIVTLETPAVPYHPLNVWSNGETRGRMNTFAQGFTASQGIFVLDASRQYRDIFGVYIPVTFQIFDNRPNIQNEPSRRVYNVEMRAGTSVERAVFRKTYNETGIYTERVYVPYGPGYYSFSVLMKTSHGLIYEDTFHLGYNVHYMDGFGMLLWLPLLMASIPIILCGKKRLTWDDEDFDADERGGGHLGILGRAVL